MYRGFNEQQEMAKVIMKVSIFDEFEGNQNSMTIEEVLVGDDRLKGEAFSMLNHGIEVDFGLYEAELEVGRYEGISAPVINCINFTQTKRG